MSIDSELKADELLLQRFYCHVAERPDEVYLTQPLPDGSVKDYTFAETLSEAKRMAAYLRSLELEEQSRIAIITKNCAHFVMTDLAIWMAGHVSVALYPTLTDDTVRYILEHCEAKLLFVGKLDDWDDVRAGVPTDVAIIAYPFAASNDFGANEHKEWDAVVAAHQPIEDDPVRDADDSALIVYTSGSTGQPKGVLHSFRTITVPTRSIVGTLSISHRDRALSYLPLAHSMDRWLSECVSLYTGVHVFFTDTLQTFARDLTRARPTLFVSVPRLWLKFQLGVFSKMPEKRLNLMLKIPILSGILKKKILSNLGLDAVRFAGSGSAPIPAELIDWYRNLGLELLEGYGMSENFNYSHMTLPGRARPGYVGHPHPGVECKISEEGEVLVKSPSSMVGYFKQEDKTRDSFTADGFLKTGDRGQIDGEGRLRITGRVKELFKTSKGKYVAPVPIENLLNADSHIELACVAGAGQPATHAVVQLAEELVPTLDDVAVRDRITRALESLLERANAELPNFERMDFLVVAKEPWTIEGGHLTPTMKIKRSVLESQYEAHLEGWYQAGQKVIWQS